MTEKVYHVGLIKGTGKTVCWSNGHRKNTIIVEMRKNKDFLSCELWLYLGERITTKESVKQKKFEMLQWINAKYNQSFTHIRID